MSLFTHDKQKKEKKPSRLILEFLTRRGGANNMGGAAAALADSSGSGESMRDGGGTSNSNVKSGSDGGSTAAEGLQTADSRTRETDASTTSLVSISVPATVSSVNATALLAPQVTPVSRTQPWVEAKERLVAAQRLLLFTLEYELVIEPATEPLFEALSKLRSFQDSKSHEVLSTIAKKTLWDALKTTLPVRFSSRQLALGVLKFAAEKVESETTRRALQAGGGALSGFYNPPTNLAEVLSMGDILPSHVSSAISESIQQLLSVTRGYDPSATGRPIE